MRLFRKKAFIVTPKNKTNKKVARELEDMLNWYYKEHGIFEMIKKFRGDK